jgi:hypothetical protein
LFLTKLDHLSISTKLLNGGFGVLVNIFSVTGYKSDTQLAGLLNMMAMLKQLFQKKFKAYG